MTDQQNGWIKSKIEMGHYGNECEVLRELIRERQLREQDTVKDVEVIRAKLLQAEANGFTDQSPANIIREIKNG